MLLMNTGNNLERLAPPAVVRLRQEEDSADDLFGG